MYKATRHYSTDPRLNELASYLADVKFELTEEEVTHFNMLWESNNLRNVSLFMDGKTFRVRLYLGGKQRTLGITTNGPAAARFADCCRLYFWPYRLRDARPPVHSDFNYDEDSTRVTLEQHESVGQHLDNIRDYLTAFGDLKLVDKVIEDGKSERKRIRESRRTVKSEIRELFLENKSEIVSAREDIDKVLVVLGGYQERVERGLAHISKQLDALAVKFSPPAPEPYWGQPPEKIP